MPEGGGTMPDRNHPNEGASLLQAARVLWLCVLVFFIALSAPSEAVQGTVESGGDAPQTVESEDDGKLSIAILQFEAVNEEAQAGNKGRMVAEMLTTEAFKTGLFHVVERHLIKKVMDEMEFGDTGFSGTEAQKIGVMLGADAVLTGAVSEFLGVLRIDARLINVQDGRILMAEDAQTQLTMKEISQSVQLLMGKMISAVGAGESHEKTGERASKEDTLPSPRMLQPLGVSASSSLKPSKFASYGPYNVIDGDHSTAWVEGSKGSGAGEWLQMSFDGEYQISEISIVNGYNLFNKADGGDRWLQNGRVRTMSISFSSGAVMEVVLRDVREPQSITFAPVRSNYVRFTIKDTYPGTKWQNDTCISEISVFGSEVR